MPRSAVDAEIPATLPALARAAKVQRRAAGWGVEWPDADSAMAALRQETENLSRAADEEEAVIGAILFAAVGAARKLGVDAESALRRTTRAFADRYERFLADRPEQAVDPESMSEDQIRELFLGR